MSTSDSLQLAEYLCSRLCHDLITPVGAINTGLELFQENPLSTEKETDEIITLISNSAQAAAARLSFFRSAFGSSGNSISLVEIKQLIDNLFVRTKFEFIWDETAESKAPLGKLGKVLLNAIFWLSECAPRGGTIQVSLILEKLTFILNLKADSIIIHQGTLEALEGQATVTDLSPRAIGCYLIYLLAKENKGEISVKKSESSIEFKCEMQQNNQDLTSAIR